MEDILSQALEIVKAQAGTRMMTADDITSMIRALTSSISSIAAGTEEIKSKTEMFTMDDAKKSVRERSVICMECGKSFKVLTKRHLETHNLTSDEYRDKWGLKKGSSLCAKSLARDRRKTMQDMKLWERRIKIEKPERPKLDKNTKSPAQAEII